MLAFILMAASVSTSTQVVEPDIVVRAPRIVVPKTRKKVQCAEPMEDWVPAYLLQRDVPLDQFRLQVTYEQQGGYYNYYCTDEDKEAFKALPKATRDAITGRLAFAEQQKILEEREWDRLMKEANSRLYRYVTKAKARDKKIVARMRYEMAMLKKGIRLPYIPMKVRELEWK
jgi:hypothetical protein